MARAEAKGLRICLIIAVVGWASGFQAVPGFALRQGMGIARAHKVSGVVGLKASSSTSEPVLKRIGTASMKKVESLKNFDVGARKRYFLWTLAERVYDEILLFCEWAVLSLFKFMFMVGKILPFSGSAEQLEEAPAPAPKQKTLAAASDEYLDKSVLATASAAVAAKEAPSTQTLDAPTINGASFLSFLMVAAPITSYYISTISEDKYMDLAPQALATLSVLVFMVDLVAGRSTGLTTWIRRQTPVRIRRTLASPRVPDELTMYQKESYEKEVNARKLVDLST